MRLDIYTIYNIHIHFPKIKNYTIFTRSFFPVLISSPRLGSLYIKKLLNIILERKWYIFITILCTGISYKLWWSSVHHTNYGITEYIFLEIRKTAWFPVRRVRNKTLHWDTLYIVRYKSLFILSKSICINKKKTYIILSFIIILYIYNLYTLHIYLHIIYYTYII